MEREGSGRKTAWKIHPEDAPHLVRLLRSFADMDQEPFAQAAGISPSSLLRYEKGRMVPSREHLKKMAWVPRVPLACIDRWLLPALTATRLARVASFSGGEPEPSEDQLEIDSLLDPAELGRAFAEACGPALGALAAELEEEGGDAWEEEDLSPAEICARLESCAHEELSFLLETCPEFRILEVAAWLCDRSEDAASECGAAANAFVELALRVTELMPVAEPARRRARAQCLIFRANALRVSNGITEARMVFAEAKGLLEEDDAAGPDLIPRWRLLDLEASLQRDSRDFKEALRLLTVAFEAAPSHCKGRILNKKAVVHEHAGQHESAIEALHEAAPYLESYPEPRLLFGCAFNLAHNLSHLNRFPEAEALLPEIRERAAALDRKLDLIRVRWLEAKIHAGFDRSAEAQAAFQEVQAEFARLEMPYDGALVGLDLAILHLAHGRTSEVRSLAEEMIWIFQSQGIHREALGSLDLFLQAARQEAATCEMAREVASLLQTARHDPARRCDVADPGSAAR
jgi:transcriptional regulator with XRE-family HTH domain